MEKNVTVTVKTKLGSLVTLRADEPQEFADRVDAAAKAGFGVAVTAYEGLINESTTPMAVDVVAQALGATVIAAPAPLAPVPPDPTDQWSAPSTTQETITDRYGNNFTYNLPNAPTCERGSMVLKSSVSKAGKPYKCFVDPAAAPKWAGPNVDKTQHAAVVWA
jgi:hypothetical protein